MRTAKNRIISEKMSVDYRKTLIEEEKSRNTVNQYMSVLEDFMRFSDGKAVDKGMAVRYKEILVETYKPKSVNAKLSALNGFFKRQGWYECIVKLVKIQNETFRPDNKVLTKEEYERLLAAASSQGKERLNLAMQTLCSMGLRAGELKFVTVESVKAGFANVTLKGKSRTVLLPKDLKKLLGGYIREKNIKEGCVFITRSGKPLDRSNLWRDMKSLAEKAGVVRSKIFPHNLRHLFACVYYAEEKNANHLADIMGHSSLNTTRIYTQGSMAEELETLNKMCLVNFAGVKWKIRDRKIRKTENNPIGYYMPHNTY